VEDEEDTPEEDPSGCFFIEDTFFVTGTVDYVKPIVDWIDGYTDQPHPTRRRYLGISTMDSLLDRTQEMKQTKLSHLPMRLGIRYYHVCHGDVETSMMLVDRHVKVIRDHQNDKSDKIAYPLIHDVWMLPKKSAMISSMPVCESCQMYQGVYVASSECEATDGGPRFVCELCCEELKLLEKEPRSVQLYTVWRNEVDLSTSAARESRLGKDLKYF
jgi:hypothetical protein